MTEARSHGLSSSSFQSSEIVRVGASNAAQNVSTRASARRRRPLAAAARAVALRIRSGQVHINNPAWTAHAPFGGYKRSGNGREYGLEGFHEYLETKAILGYGEEQPT